VLYGISTIYMMVSIGKAHLRMLDRDIPYKTPIFIQ